MIAALSFGRADGNGVRTATFVPRAGIPLTAACLVANGVREALREFVTACEVTLGEPAAIGHDAWRTVAHDAHCFLVRGRLTDIVLVLGERHARSLVRTAFGEGDTLGAGAFSALEHQAMERIVARCAAALDPLCAERRGPARALAPGDVPACVAYFDIRVQAPVPFDLGIGIVRDLPDPGPGTRLTATALGRIAIDVHAEFARGTLTAARFLALRVGDVVRLDTKVGSPGALKAGGKRIALGISGETGAHRALRIGDHDPQGVWPA